MAGRAGMVLNTDLGKMQEGPANTGGGNGATEGLRQEGKEERRALVTGPHLKHRASAPHRAGEETRGWQECMGRGEQQWTPLLLPHPLPPHHQPRGVQGPTDGRESGQLPDGAPS